MIARLIRAHLARPWEGWRTLRALRAYRAAHEDLRGSSFEDVATAQISRAAERIGICPESIAQYVERWMEREPLTILRRHVHPGLLEFLEACRDRGIRLAVLSDYPAEAKLRALGIAEWFEVTLCAQAPEIGVFKPHPRGLTIALNRLALTPRECLYIGDRADVDALAAKSAGISCVIVARNATKRSESHVTVRGYRQLQDHLFGPPALPPRPVSVVAARSKPRAGSPL
jgi:HAD superfamily hydrolase (TIGR01509 family)